MRKFTKALSLLLSVVMLLSALGLSAFAAEFVWGSEDASKINYKYEVSKVTEAPMADGSATYSGDDIYGVTIYAKCSDGIQFLQAPIQFNKNHYAPIMIYDGEAVYQGSDTYYTDMGEDAAYVYSLGDAWNHTGMFRANGSVATTKALASLIGLGNSNASPVAVTIQLYSADHPNYARVHAGLADDVGMVGVCLDDSGLMKNAYLNVTEGNTVNPDWVKMATVYFQRLEGVTDADCVGDVFGASAGCFGVDGATDSSGAPSRAAATYKLGNPGCTVVSIATVAGEAPAAPVLTKAASQVKMTLTSATTVAEPFQYRVISKISGDDWNEYFANTGTENAGTNAITSVGFVAYKGAAAFDLETAKAVANGATAADYAAKETDYIQYDGSEAKFGCRIDFTAKPENDVTYIAYAKYLDANGAAQVVFYDAAESSPVASKYTEMVAAYVGLYGSTFVG